MQEQTDLVQGLRRALVEPVAFVLSTGNDGTVGGLACSWNMKVSYDPPVFAVAIGKIRHTLSLIEQSGEFVVVFPSTQHEAAIEYFGTVSGRHEDKVAKAGLKTVPSKHLKTPLVADARLNFECKVRNRVDEGDHYVYFADVLAIHLDETRSQLYYTGKDSSGTRTYANMVSYA